MKPARHLTGDGPQEPHQFAEEGHLVVIDLRSVAKESRHGEGEDRQGGDDGADGGGRRQGVIVWTL